MSESKVLRSPLRLSFRAAAVLLVVLVSVGAVGSAGARPGGLASVLDHTYSCPANTLRQGGPLEVTFAANTITTNPGNVFLGEAVGAQTNAREYLGFITNRPGFVHSSVCRLAKSIPLRSRGLPLNGVFTSQRFGGFSVRCTTNGRVDARLQMSLTNGAVTRALIALRDEKGGAPLAFVQWSPKREVVYLAKSCH
jgi:hypothetical protein